MAGLSETRELRRRPTRFVVHPFGTAERRGRLRLGRRVYAVVGFGRLALDLRSAELTDGESTVVAVNLAGRTEIDVPANVDVDVSGFVLLGRRSFDEPAPRPGAPRLRIRAAGVLGRLTVRTAT